MSELTSVLRLSRTVDCCVIIDLPETGWTPLHTLSGGPSLVIDGWHAGPCIELNPECRLLITYHDSGVADARVINSDLVTICALSSLTPAVDASMAQLVDEFAEIFMVDLRRTLLTGSANEVYKALRSFGPDLPSILASRTIPSPRIEPCISGETLCLSGDFGPVTIKTADLQHLLTLFALDETESSHPWLVPAARAGLIKVPALSQAGHVDATYLITRLGSAPVYACSELKRGLRYYFISRRPNKNAIYFPFDNLLIRQSDDVTDEAGWRAVLGQVDRSIAALAGQLTEPPKTTNGLGLYTFGIPHLGHALWQEISAIDTFLAELTPAARPGNLYMVSGITGCEVYGDIQQLYPELAGHVIRRRSEPELLAGAIQAGVGLVLISGDRIMQGPRARISACVDAYARERSLDTKFDRLCGDAESGGDAKKPLVIAFGLRLMNRCPINTMELYVDLTRVLRKRLGPLIVVIDGISGPDAFGGIAAPIYNGVADGTPDKLNNAQDSSLAMLSEYQFVDGYVRAVEQTDISTVSCVGKPMRENLFWLSKASFFVAPYGAGLVKVRWIYDKPGYVLLSQANRKNFNVERIFTNDAAVEPPFAPLYISSTNEVTDLPLNPPRTEPPGPVHLVPHPENFIVDKAVVLPRICDLVAAHRNTSIEHPWTPGKRRGWRRPEGGRMRIPQVLGPSRR